MVGKTEYSQRQYYTETAHLYDDMHISPDDEHYVALEFITNFFKLFEITNILDVGCGTGRGVRHFIEQKVAVIGVEPVRAMIDIAVSKNKIPREYLICGSGEALPFNDASFDAVCEFGVLHHVKHPNILVKEMMRCAKKAIFLSDSNIFGQGSRFVRFSKLILHKINLLGVAYFIKTFGKGYHLTASDGIAYPYSVFNSFDLLSNWADRILLIPTRKEETFSWFHPLLTSSHLLLCAIRG